MATTVIHNTCFAGAMQGLMSSRYVGSFTPADYAALANAAQAIATEFLVENAALSVPMTDADNANIGSVVHAVAMATVVNSGAVSTTATDYLTYAKQIAAASKEGVAQLY